MSHTPARNRTLGCALVLALITSACAPPDTLESGINSYSTDIVLGSQTKGSSLPPVPQSTLAPTFPSFIVSSPPPFPLADAIPVTTEMVESNEFGAPPPEVIADDCPLASASEPSLPAVPDIAQPPEQGVYPYRQNGSYTINGVSQSPLPDRAERTVRNLTVRSDKTFTHDVVITQFGATTTTSFDLVRRAGQSDVDGIYITRIVEVNAKGETQTFDPVDPGMRILPLPARVGQTWASVAADPLSGTATRLEGVVREVGRVEACGKRADGYLSQVKISTRLLGTPENETDIVIESAYIIATQLGGLIIADGSRLTGKRRGATIVQEASSNINSLRPVQPVPK